MRISKQQLEAIKHIYFRQLNEAAEQVQKEAARKNVAAIRSEKALVDEYERQKKILTKLELDCEIKLEKLKRTDIRLSEWNNEGWEHLVAKLLLGADSLDKLEAMIAEAVKKAVK